MLSHASRSVCRCQAPDRRPVFDAGCSSAVTRAHGDAGWPSVDAYYAGSCSSDSIPSVKIPLFCIQARHVLPSASVMLLL